MLVLKPWCHHNMKSRERGSAICFNYPYASACWQIVCPPALSTVCMLLFFAHNLSVCMPQQRETAISVKAAYQSFHGGETLWSWRVTLPAGQHKRLLVGLSTVMERGGRTGFLLVVENVWLKAPFLNIVEDENEHFRHLVFSKLHKMNPSTPDCAASRTPTSYTCLIHWEIIKNVGKRPVSQC